jgi:serine/threonine protein kinase
VADWSNRPLLHYELLAPLGAGAMGEVYRARDTKLGREVAIKLLPEHFAADEERLRRFAREAQSIAALNHPNVAQIYGVDQVEDTCFLVLELVPGETLEERLRRGPLAIDEALDVARQIADGLEAAHEAGVIHRDLKPANVRITPDGRVKLLDFGLAKPVHGADAHAHGDGVSTTEAGRLLGTPGYMAPEQARGKPIDKRVDVWAFGCVLYECLIGRRAFTGETVADCLAAVVRAEPDLGRLPAETPRGARQVLARSFEKDAKLRLRDIGEARILLADRSLESSARSAARIPWLVASLAGTLALIAGVAWFARSAAPTQSGPPWRFSRLTDVPGVETQPDLSPDGDQIVYASRAAGNSDIYLLRVGGSRAINLTQDCELDDGEPAFSPDGQSIVFRSERDGGGLYVMGATGESVRRVTDRGHDPAWSSDGSSIAFASEAVSDPLERITASQLFVVDLAGGAPRRLLETDAVQPAWSPDGRWIAYWSNSGGQRDVWLIQPSGGGPVSVTQDAPTDWSPAWSPDGRLYFSSDRAGSMDVWSLAIDAASGEPQGEPRQETSGVRGLAFVGFASDGRRMVCAAYDRTHDIEVSSFDPEAEALTPLFVHRQQALNVRSLSPDGSWLACSTMGAREDIVLLRADGSESRRLTSDAAKDRTPLWSPDGSTIHFKSTRTGTWQPWLIAVDGSGLTQSAQLGVFDDVVWSPDGREVLHRIGARGERAIVRYDPRAQHTAASAVRVASAPELDDFVPEAWNPLRPLVAGMRAADDGTAAEYGLFDLETKAYRALSPVPAGMAWQTIGGWLPDGRHLLCRTGEGMVCHDVETGSSKLVASCGPRDRFRISHDGRVVVLVRGAHASDVWLAERD